jgi:hypothetical protein
LVITWTWNGDVLPLTEERSKELELLFRQLREKVATYSPLFDIRIHNERRYELWLEKNLLIDGRKRKEVVFASLIIQKDIVGFYFRPVDAKPELTKAFSPELAKLLKGKSCFHIKKLVGSLLEKIEKALEVGFTLYLERGCV